MSFVNSRIGRLTPPTRMARSIFKGKTRAIEREILTARRANALNLDDELLLPLPAGRGDQTAPIRLARCNTTSDDAAKQRASPCLSTSFNFNPIDPIDTAFDAEGRRWPKLLPPPRNFKRELEDKIKQLSDELTLRCVQIADLSNIRQQQDDDLRTARYAIDDRDKAIAVLQDAITKIESEATAAQNTLQLSSMENTALHTKIEKLQRECTELLKRCLDVETAFNNREVVIAAAREKLESLERELATKRKEETSLRAAVHEAGQQRYDKLNQQVVFSGIQIKELELTLAQRDRQLNELHTSHSKLVKQCDDLTKTVDSIEGAMRSAEQKIKSQGELVEVLEKLLRIERETAALKIKGLKAELHCEGSMDTPARSNTTAVREDIVDLSSKLAERRRRAYESKVDTSMSEGNAA